MTTVALNPDKILASILITPDGTELRSRHVHDCVGHNDANGKYYMLDGGMDYVRSSYNQDEAYITICHKDGHPIKRNWIEWGAVRNGKHIWVKLKHLSCAHIEAILRTQMMISPELRDTLIDEQIFRECEGIHIAD